MAARGEGFYPGRAAIESYGDGGFRFAGMSHRGGILLLPSGVHAWDAAADRALTPDDFADVLSETEPFDVLLVGTGPDIRPLSPAIRAASANAASRRRHVHGGGGAHLQHPVRRGPPRRRRFPRRLKGRAMAGLTAAELSDRVAGADRDRWLASLFLPEGPRADVHALLAFSAEIASVRDHVSAPLAGEIRLQWWRDALADPAAGRGHPLAETLADVIARRRLPVAALASLIDARVFDLYDDAAPSLIDLEGYLGETASALFQLSALILADGVDPGTAELAGHAGVAYGLTGLMRALPLTSGRGQCFLPADRLAAHGASRETVVARQATPGVLGRPRRTARRRAAASCDRPRSLAPGTSRRPARFPAARPRWAEPRCPGASRRHAVRR